MTSFQVFETYSCNIVGQTLLNLELCGIKEIVYLSFTDP